MEKANYSIAKISVAHIANTLSNGADIIRQRRWRTIYLWFGVKYAQNIGANYNHKISAPILWDGAGAVVVEETIQIK